MHYSLTCILYAHLICQSVRPNNVYQICNSIHRMIDINRVICFTRKNRISWMILLLLWMSRHYALSYTSLFIVSTCMAKGAIQCKPYVLQTYLRDTKIRYKRNLFVCRLFHNIASLKSSSFVKPVTAWVFSPVKLFIIDMNKFVIRYVMYWWYLVGK